MKHLTIQQLSASLDGALAGVSLELVVRHLGSCRECRDRHSRLSKQNDALRRLLGFDPTELQLADALARVEATLAQEVRGATEQPPSAAMRAPAPAPAAVAVPAPVPVPAPMPVPMSVPMPAPMPAPAPTPAATSPPVPRPPRAPRRPLHFSRKARIAASAMAAIGVLILASTFIPPVIRITLPALPTLPTPRVPRFELVLQSEPVPVETVLPPMPIRVANARAAVPQLIVPAEPQPLPARESVTPTIAPVRKPAPAPVRAPAPAPAPAPQRTIAPVAEAPADEDASWPLLCGVVSDATGAPVAGARVALADLELSARTDRRGRFCLSAPPGERTLSVIAQGFAVERRLIALGPAGLDVPITLADHE